MTDASRDIYKVIRFEMDRNQDEDAIIQKINDLLIWSFEDILRVVKNIEDTSISTEDRNKRMNQLAINTGINFIAFI